MMRRLLASWLTSFFHLRHSKSVLVPKSAINMNTSIFVQYSGLRPHVAHLKAVNVRGTFSRKHTDLRIMAQAGGPETQEKAKTSGNFTLRSSGQGRYKVAPGENINFATAAAQAFFRFGSGAFVSGKLSPTWNRPKQPIELFEFEGCPFCRKVREAASILDIDVKYYPCPAGGPTWRPQAVKESGKSQFPYMKDPNTGRSMLESDAIIKYLFTEYGDGVVPLTLNLGPLTTLTAGLGLLPRAGKGSRYRPSNLPKKALEIWGYEASPFVKLVREHLCELEIPHIYHTVARKSPKRKEMENKWQTFQVPYLEDPNTNEAYFETKAIISYINDRYAK